MLDMEPKHALVRSNLFHIGIIIEIRMAVNY